MSLKIYTNEQEIPSGIKLVTFNDVFFDSFCHIPSNPIVDEILSTLDGGKRVSDESFEGKFIEKVALDKRFLCTGTKTLLNLMQHPSDYCFDVVECGDNALSLLPRFREGHILWKHCTIPWLSDKYDCDVILYNTHFTNFNNVADSLYYKEVRNNA